MITKSARPRGRPRGFDPEAAVATAAQLFHAHGYDAVTVTNVIEALGIKPPSFYAAFGSKLDLYARVLTRYSDNGAIPFGELLRPEQTVAEGLLAVLEEAARRYAADPAAAGCMVVEGTRCMDAGARAAALAYNLAAEELIRAYIATRHPEEADRLTDFVTTTMFGLSAKARSGHGVDKLLATARLAGAAIEQAFAA